jgi:cobalt-zinc-cadmium efflux system membrane fusion protein
MENMISTANRSRIIIISLVSAVLLAVVLIPQFFRQSIGEDAPTQFRRVNGFVFVPDGSPLRERLGIGEVSMQVIRTEVSAPATVEAKPSMRANIFPPAGGRIVKLFVNMGQSVRAGQALFEIYSPDIAEVQTEYISARSALVQAERGLRRKEDLHKKGITPLRELEEASTEFEIAQSEMDGALQKLRIMGIEEDQIAKPLIVRSPINGRVVDLNVAPGEFIADPDEPLLIIADLSQVWVIANIQEKDIRFIKPSADVQASFAAYPGELYEGKVLFVSDILNEETRTTRVIVEFSNEDLKLKPGMFASVKLLSEPAPQIVVDQKAVLQRRDYSYVYVQHQPFMFEKRIITTGDLVDDKIVVLEGLTVNELIVSQNAVTLP